MKPSTFRAPTLGDLPGFLYSPQHSHLSVRSDFPDVSVTVLNHSLGESGDSPHLKNWSKRCKTVQNGAKRCKTGHKTGRKDSKTGTSPPLILPKNRGERGVLFASFSNIRQEERGVLFASFSQRTRRKGRRLCAELPPFSQRTREDYA